MIIYYIIIDAVHRRRINTEEKAKVVVGGIEFIFILKVSILYVVSLSIIKIF